MSDVLAAARYLLPSRGRLFLIYPALRLSECLGELAVHKLVPTRLQMVHPRVVRRASHFLLEAAKSEGPELVVAEPLITHEVGTAEYGDWYGELLGHVE
jgi:tRNA1Val (adenine37-N6)-methyltransferase